MYDKGICGQVSINTQSTVDQHISQHLIYNWSVVCRLSTDMYRTYVSINTQLHVCKHLLTLYRLSTEMSIEYCPSIDRHVNQVLIEMLNEGVSRHPAVDAFSTHDKSNLALWAPLFKK